YCRPIEPACVAKKCHSISANVSGRGYNRRHHIAGRGLAALAVNSIRSSVMSAELIDGFGRKIDYVRLSVTDRCDFRCIYCMAEDMTFLPRQRILTLEE